jgi:hypothetical protein
MLSDGRQPGFDHDYQFGAQGQLLIDGLMEGIRNGSVRVETKRKSIPDLLLFVETSHDPGRTGTYIPSGLSVSTADYWAFVIAATGMVVWIPSARLRRAVELKYGTYKDAGQNGSCPTRGWVIHLAAVMSARCNP